MSLFQLIFVLLLLIVSPFVMFFLGKWSAFGWFSGKYSAEKRFSRPKGTHKDIR